MKKKYLSNSNNRKNKKEKEGSKYLGISDAWSIIGDDDSTVSPANPANQTSPVPVCHQKSIGRDPNTLIKPDKKDIKDNKKDIKDNNLRVERIWIMGNQEISQECKYSNNLRNEGQYQCRKRYFENRDEIRSEYKRLKKLGITEKKIKPSKKYLTYKDLDKMKYDELKESYYKMRMAALAQGTLSLVGDSWESYIENITKWRNDPKNYGGTGRPKIPGYGDKDGEYILLINNQLFWIVSGQDIEDCWNDRSDNKKVNTLVFADQLSWLGINNIRTTLDDKADLRELRIVPAGVGYWIEIVYMKKKVINDINDINDTHKEINLVSDLDPNIVNGIDLGLRNIVTKGCVKTAKAAIKTAKAVIKINEDNTGDIIGQPIIIKGGVLKGINQYYNKRRSEIQSIYEHQAWRLKRELRHLNFQYSVKMKNSPKEERDRLWKEIKRVKGELKKIRTGPAITKLTFKRKNKIDDVMHKYSRWIINDNIEKRSGTLVIGHNKGQKQSIELGRITNQNFVFIPFCSLIKKIKYKGEDIGMKIIIREEAHTSKCSVIDEESVEHHDKYLGQRIYKKGISNGGLFRSSKGIIINADVQGEYNIIKKEFPKVKLKMDRIQGVGLHPVRVNPLIRN